MRIFHPITLLTLFCLMAGQTVVCGQDLLFPERQCNFGTIHEKDGKVTRQFTFRNDRRDTVVICDITTACRCITGEPSFVKVAPGEVGNVRLTFDPAYRSGPFEYSVTLWYMNRKLHQTVKVKGTVEPMVHPIEEDHPYYWGGGLFTSHKVLSFGKLRSGESGRMFFRYGNGTDKEMDLRFEVEGCCAHAIEMERHLVLAPDQRGKLYVTLTMPEGFNGNHINRIWLVVNGVRLPEPILVRMTSRE